MATYIYARRAPACALVVRRRRCGSIEAGNRGVRARDLALDFHVTSARSRVGARVSAVCGRSLSPNFSFFSLVPPDLPIRSAHTPASDASAILRAAFATAVFDATSRALLPPSVCRLLRLRVRGLSVCSLPTSCHTSFWQPPTSRVSSVGLGFRWGSRSHQPARVAGEKGGASWGFHYFPRGSTDMA